jgi:hypothetical protein
MARKATAIAILIKVRFIICSLSVQTVYPVLVAHQEDLAKPFL